jgi:dihydroflavonol-4-reductase
MAVIVSPSICRLSCRERIGMRVLVTGGTGFVGSHTVAALLAAGHAVRLLVRSPERIAPALEPLGVGGVEWTAGDVTDVDAVKQALDGCDAVVHAANVYSFDPWRRAEMHRVNIQSTKHILETASERGLDPIVHVSSVVALLPSTGTVLTAESPVGNPEGPYARSKMEAERIARTWQARGAPVVITHPGVVLGPHDPHDGESARTVCELLQASHPPVIDGGYPIVDVRDVAAVHAAVLQSGRGARRYLATGHDVRYTDLAALLARLSGRSQRPIHVPIRLVLALGRAADAIGKVTRLRLPLSHEPVWITSCGARTDSSATGRELGVSFRPLEATLVDTVRWLYQAGRLSAKHAGQLAGPSAAS